MMAAADRARKRFRADHGGGDQVSFDPEAEGGDFNAAVGGR